jgi:hypothetical protein
MNKPIIIDLKKAYKQSNQTLSSMYSPTGVLKLPIEDQNTPKKSPTCLKRHPVTSNGVNKKREISAEKTCNMLINRRKFLQG